MAVVHAVPVEPKIWTYSGPVIHAQGWPSWARHSAFLVSFTSPPRPFRQMLTLLSRRENRDSAAEKYGFTGDSLVQELPANAGDAGSIPVSGRSLGGKKKWQPTPVFLPGKAHGQRSLVGYSQWGHKELGHILGTKQQWPLCKDLSIRKWPQSRLRPPPSPGSTSPQNLPSPRAQPTTR